MHERDCGEKQRAGDRRCDRRRPPRIRTPRDEQSNRGHQRKDVLRTFRLRQREEDEWDGNPQQEISIEPWLPVAGCRLPEEREKPWECAADQIGHEVPRWSGAFERAGGESLRGFSHEDVAKKVRDPIRNRPNPRRDDDDEENQSKD